MSVNKYNMKYTYERQPTKLDIAIDFQFTGHEVSNTQQSFGPGFWS